MRKSGRAIACPACNSAPLFRRRRGPTPGAITFSPAAGVQNPTKLPGNSANDIACFWELGAIGSSLQGSNYLGVITFQVPTNAQTGQSYALHFLEWMARRI